jgi:hypothetical protein
VLIWGYLRKPSASMAVGVAILSAFVAYLVLQHRMVFPYHDDWGLAVLDYVCVVNGFEGRSFTIAQSLDFFSQLYMRWSGRIVPFFIQVWVFKGGVDAVRAFQVAMVACTVLLTVRLAGAGRALSWALAVPVALYLAIPLFVAARGLYWYTAASQSLWGMPVLFLGALVASRTSSVTPVAAVLLAAASLFSEMMSATALVLLGTLVLMQFAQGIPRDRLVRQLVLCVPSALAAGFVVLAPGNFARAAQSEYGVGGPLGVAWANVARIAELVTQHPSSRPFLILWGLAVAALVVRTFQVRGLQFGMYALVASGGLLILGFSVPIPGAFAAIWVVHAGLLLVLRGQPGAVAMLGLLLGAAATVVPLMASPAVFPRSLLNLYLCLFPPLTWAVVAVASHGPRTALGLTAVFLAATIPAFGNARDVYGGYAQSLPMHRENERALERAAESAKTSSGSALVVRHYILPTIRFAEVMPYQKRAIETWIKKYYALPPDTRFDYRSPEELNSGSGP